MKKLIIVESPNKVQTIQKYLGDKYIVQASNGHIVDLSKGGEFGIGVNPNNKFKTHYSMIPNKFRFIENIISNLDNIEQIIICTDPDTEGHAIAWHIAEKLKYFNKPILRGEFHELTEQGIKNGISNLGNLDFNKFKAQETRRILDRIVGFMVSPFLINHYGMKLSAGRVQSVTTRMVIEREKEISEFKPQEYWNISVSLTKDKNNYIAKYSKKIKSKDEAEKIKLEIEYPNISESEFRAIEVVKKPKKENPPPPLTTAKMQQVMASKFSIDGERTMAAAQSLYESGYVTYIRTDSVRISDEALLNVRNWLSKNNFEIPTKPFIFKNKEAAQNAHECIRPTVLNNTPEVVNLNGDNRILYELIWKQFVSSQMCSAIYDTLNVKIEHAHSKHSFKLTGKLLVSPGYLTILENKKESKTTLPSLNKNDLLKLTDEESIVLDQKFTQPPARYNYSSLIAELENKGIGRPSTYVDIIGKITNRNYVEKQGNTYHGTELGTKITDKLSQYFEFMNYDYTALLEKQMDDISIGNIDNIHVLNNFYNSFIKTLQQAHIDNDGKICKKCGAPMYLKNGKNDVKFWGCGLYPFCRGVR